MLHLISENKKIILLMFIPLLAGIVRLLHFYFSNYLLPDEALYYVAVDRFFYEGKMSLAYSTRTIFQYMIFIPAVLFNLNTFQKCISFMIFMSSLVSSATVYVVYRILKVVNRESSYAVLFLTISPAFLILSFCVLTESFSLFFFSIGTLMLLSKKFKFRLNIFLSGLMYALAFNLREPYAFSILFGAFYLIYKREYKSFMVFCLGVLPLFYIPGYFLVPLRTATQSWNVGILASFKDVGSRSPVAIIVEKTADTIASTSNPNVTFSEPESIIAYPPDEYYYGNITTPVSHTLNIEGKISIPLTPSELKLMREEIIGRSFFNFNVQMPNFAYITMFRILGESLVLSVGVNAVFIVYGVLAQIYRRNVTRIFFFAMISVVILVATAVFVADRTLYTTEERLLFQSLSTLMRLGHPLVFAVPLLYPRRLKKKFVSLFIILMLVISPLYLIVAQSNLSAVYINRLYSYKSPWLKVDNYFAIVEGSKLLLGEPIERVMLYRRINVTYILPPENYTSFQEVLNNSSWNHVYFYGEKHTIHYMVIQHNFPWYYDMVINKTRLTVIWDDEDSYLYELNVTEM